MKDITDIKSRQCARAVLQPSVIRCLAGLLLATCLVSTTGKATELPSDASTERPFSNDRAQAYAPPLPSCGGDNSMLVWNTRWQRFDCKPLSNCPSDQHALNDYYWSVSCVHMEPPPAEEKPARVIYRWD